MSLLETSWIIVLTSGHTIDGREVKPSVVEEMAETYNTETYNARINVDHSTYGTKLGSVLAAKVQDAVVNGVDCKQLLLKLNPNDWLLYLIQQGQKLHTSVEFVTDFAKTGKAYLTGLALTDNPASIGTTEIKLSVNGNDVEIMSTNEAINLEPEKSGLLAKIFNKEENTMADKATLEVLTQMQQQMEDNNTALETVSAALIKLTEANVEEPNKDDAENKSNEAITALKQQIDGLKTNLENQESAFSELKTNLENQTDEPLRTGATGLDDDNQEIY